MNNWSFFCWFFYTILLISDFVERRTGFLIFDFRPDFFNFWLILDRLWNESRQQRPRVCGDEGETAGSWKESKRRRFGSKSKRPAAVWRRIGTAWTFGGWKIDFGIRQRRANKSKGKNFFRSGKKKLKGKKMNEKFEVDPKKMEIFLLGHVFERRSADV